MKLKHARSPITDAVVARLGVDPEIAALLRDLTSETFNQEIGALFTEYVGRVFKEFDEEVHVRDLEYNPAWTTYAAVDYGFTNPFVWLLVQVGPFGEVHVLDEVYETGLTIDEAATAVRARGLAPQSCKKFFPDPASPGDTKRLAQVLRVAWGTGTGGEVKDRVEMIRLALRPKPEHLPDDHPEKRPQLLINRRCVNTIREFNDYRYPKSAEEAAAKNTNAPELPMKKDDHTPEALGRFFAGYFGLRAVGGGSRIRVANVNG